MIKVKDHFIASFDFKIKFNNPISLINNQI